MSTSLLLNAGFFQLHSSHGAIKDVGIQQRRSRLLALSSDSVQQQQPGVESVTPLFFSRREALHILGNGAASSALCQLCEDVKAASLPQQALPRLCDEACEKDLENISTVTTDSGLQYKDIKVGTGPTPPVGYQVAANYVAMDSSGRVFDSSLEKGSPYIFRVGAGQVIRGLDEGILSMKVGGKRRLYIPGPLAFPKGLPASAGRPRVLPNSPVMFDVSLEYVPGLDDVEE